MPAPPQHPTQHAPDDQPTSEQRAPAPQPDERSLPQPLAIERVLVPVDGTTYAERALPYAAALAAATGARVTLAHIRTPHAPKPPPRYHSLVEPLIGDLQHVDVADFATYLAWLRAWMRPYVPEVAIALDEAGAAGPGLLALMARQRTSVVVMASHARQGMERYFLGSVADELVRAGSAPVLVIPPLAEAPRQRIPFMTRLLLPLDGSALAEGALGPVIGWLGRPTPSELTPREVVLFRAESSQHEVRHAERYLQRLCTRLAPLVPSVQVTTVAAQGSAPGAIVMAADEGVVSPTGQRHPADLVVMATHGRSGLGRWLYGSVAEGVVSRVSVPVLLTHAAEVD